MRLRDLHGWDRKMAIINAGVALFLIVGLLLSGGWLFLFHEPDLAQFSIGPGRPVIEEPTGMAGLHSTLGDLLAGLALWITAWMSYRVIARISRAGVAAMVVVAIGILTGGTIRVDATLRDGELVETTGYSFVFAGDYDVVIAGTRDFEPLTAIAWTTAHLLSLPIAVAVIVVAYLRSQRRLDNAPTPDASWLDHLER